MLIETSVLKLMTALSQHVGKARTSLLKMRNLLGNSVAAEWMWDLGENDFGP